MSFQIHKTKIPGCYEIIPKRIMDVRGSFTKTFHKDVFLENGLDIQFAEEYFSISRKGVLRGLHFQLPPDDHVKIVYCLSGGVIDVVVDLRIGSPTYGGYEMFQLTADQVNMIYIPKGLAHGFYVTEEPAVMLYKTSTVYNPESDYGIHWSSLGVPWPDKTPIISERDGNFPHFHQFRSPFSYPTE